MAAPAVVPLHAALTHRQLVVVGDPGSGKTTFVRRVACALAESLLGDVPNAAEARLGLKDTPLPVLVRVADLVEYVEHVAQLRRAQSEHPTSVESPAWLPHFLGAASREANWGLDQELFQERLEDGSALVLLDGLDEAPDRLARGSVARLIQNAAAAYSKCRFVVTSRPAAYTDEAVLAGFEHAWIDPLGDEAIHTFLTRWCEALYPGSPGEAAGHRDELLAALASRPDMRRLARNPVMLTALAVVHWNERRLPEQRADLYDSIIKWLARSREQRTGRSTAERCVALLHELALAMQNHPDGRQVQVPKRWAAEALAREMGADGHSRHRIERAMRFLEEEELDSGLVIARGNELRFWHLTFQEFLAAKALAARTDLPQRKLLFGKPKKFYLPEWREVVVLLAGVLHQQGKPKVDGLVSAVLKDLGRSPSLAVRARCAGLLGVIFRDLRPLGYEPADLRYQRLLDEVESIFDAGRAQSVPIKDRIEAAEALGQAGDARIDPKHPKYWVTIPAGEFLMGSQKADPSKDNYDDEAYGDELPLHEVSLNEYRIAAYPTTVGEYQRFVEHGGYDERRCWSAGGFGDSTEPENWAEQAAFPNRPVVGVSWYDAMAYAAWSGCRLPTEAEWERAARGTQGRKFPWGNDPADPSRLNYDGSNIGRATPVGIYPLGATPEGIYDMAGNALEWCQDPFAPYRTGVQTEPDPSEDKRIFRVVRGGSWIDYSWFARAAYRGDNHPGVRSFYLGFRVVGVA
jgi:formylglycine-generating enzyme required for sulfatase activity